MRAKDRDRVNADGEKNTARWQSIDAARGIALAAMVVYHFTWDLSFLRYIDPGTATAPGWAWFAKSIAASFLALSGVSFALASRNGLRRGPYLRRLGLIVAAAFAVSLGTAFAVPHAPVIFGILHCIAAASLLLPLFQGRPALVSFVAAVAFWAATPLFASPFFDGPVWSWLGLNVTPLSAVDHVPLLPWAGWAFFGHGAMQWMLARGDGENNALLRGWQARTPVGRALTFSGRHSLAIYLIHQPVLIGILWIGAPAPDPARDFIAACEAGCRAGSTDIATCQRYCACVTSALRKQTWWQNVLDNRLSPQETSQAQALAAQCQRQR